MIESSWPYGDGEPHDGDRQHLPLVDVEAFEGL
jgi:hypothetical protein